MKKMKKGPACYENWKAANGGTPVHLAYEYPLYTDARIIGNDLSDGYGPYQILNCVRHQPNQPRPALVLYVEHHLKYEPEVKLKTEADTYHGGNLQDEIAALLSLCLGIRLKSGDANRSFGASDDRGRPISYGFAKDPIPPIVDERPILPNAVKEHHLEEAMLLRNLLELEPSNAVTLIRAARLYQEAIWIVESTPELSWLMFTSAIETAASAWRRSTETAVESLKLSKPKLIDIINELGGDELVTRVANELDGLFGATRNFVDFVLQFLPEPPSHRSYEWAQHSWDSKIMKRSLKLIYDHRSKALHGGIPFPAPMSSQPISVAENPALVEVPVGLATTTRGATWAKKDTPMLLHTFEYIVRHALSNWWKSMIEPRG